MNNQATLGSKKEKEKKCTYSNALEVTTPRV